VVRYIRENVDKRSLRDDQDHPQKLDALLSAIIQSSSGLSPVLALEVSTRAPTDSCSTQTTDPRHGAE
jgi:hypothetical protein